MQHAHNYNHTILCPFYSYTCMEKRCVQLEEVDKDSSGLWGGESQTPPKETSVERETPPSSDTPHVVETPPSNSSTTPPLVETPPSSDTPHVVEIPPSNSSTTPPVVAVETPPSDSGTNRDPASSGEAVTKQLKRALTLCTEDNTPVLKRSKRMKGRHSTTPMVKRRRMNKKINKKIDTNICQQCQQAGDEENWVGCDYCPRWFHINCVRIDQHA